MSDPRSLLTAALTAADRGWPVFLLGRSKRPLANCGRCPKQRDPRAHDPQACECLTCHGFYAATTDADRLAAMVAAHPDGLLALRTGAAPDGAGVVAIDIDPRNGGHYDTDLMGPTHCHATGNHGWHLFYRHPGTPVLSRGLPGGVGVDVKGEGGYVVLPPSVHPSTRRPYRCVDGQAEQEMPPRLAQMVLTPSATADPGRVTTRHPARAHSRGAAAGSEPIRHSDRLVDACLNRVRLAPEGRRRNTLYGAARGIARVILAGHLEHATGVELLTDAGRAADQTDRDIHAAITGGFAAEGLA